ncbi:unnamed protein product [Lota lota]
MEARRAGPLSQGSMKAHRAVLIHSLQTSLFSPAAVMLARLRPHLASDLLLRGALRQLHHLRPGAAAKCGPACCSSSALHRAQGGGMASTPPLLVLPQLTSAAWSSHPQQGGYFELRYLCVGGA